MYEELLFNEINLASIEGFNITDVALDAPPQSVISSGKLARADGIKIFNKEYGGRKINVLGHITTNSRANYLDIRSKLLGYLEPIEKTLRVFDGVKYKDFTATVQNTIIGNAMGGFATVDIEFMCSDPYAYDTTYTVLLDAENVTASTEDMTFLAVVDGNFEAPFEITVTVQGITGGSEQAYIRLTSEAGTWLRIDRTWADDDVITIDTKAKECKVNGLFQDYTGNFFNLKTAETYMTLDTNLTTHSSYATLKYKQRTL